MSREFDPEALFPDIRCFRYKHLPAHLKTVSHSFWLLARTLVENFVNGDAERRETEFALRKLIEAKDCAVRAVVFGKEKDNG